MLSWLPLGFATLRQPQQPRRVLLRHPVELLVGEPLAAQRQQKRGEGFADAPLPCKIRWTVLISWKLTNQFFAVWCWIPGESFSFFWRDRLGFGRRRLKLQAADVGDKGFVAAG